MKLKTALEKLLDFTASLVAMVIPSIPVGWLLRLSDSEFRQLVQSVGFQDYRVTIAIGVGIWLIAVMLLNRLFERSLDQLLQRPRKPWIRK